jgi:hypothetical protein
LTPSLLNTLFQQNNIGDDINDKISFLLSSVYQVICMAAHETDMVVSAAQCISAVATSSSRNQQRIAHIVTSEHVMNIATYIAGVDCHLSGEGLSAAFEAITRVFIKSNQQQYFNTVSIQSRNFYFLFFHVFF